MALEADAAAVAVAVCIFKSDEDAVLSVAEAVAVAAVVVELVVGGGVEGEAGEGGEGEPERDPREESLRVLVEEGGGSSNWGSRLIRSLVALARASLPFGGASCEMTDHSESRTSPKSTEERKPLKARDSAGERSDVGIAASSDMYI